MRGGSIREDRYNSRREVRQQSARGKDEQPFIGTRKIHKKPTKGGKCKIFEKWGRVLPGYGEKDPWCEGVPASSKFNRPPWGELLRRKSRKEVKGLRAKLGVVKNLKCTRRAQGWMQGVDVEGTDRAVSGNCWARGGSYRSETPAKIRIEKGVKRRRDRAQVTCWAPRT